MAERAVPDTVTIGEGSCCAGGRNGAAAASLPVSAPFRRTVKGLPERLVRLNGGSFLMGCDANLLPLDGEGPSRRVSIGRFAVDPFAVTNAWFEEFVRDTGYVTDAERIGWSFVFHAFLGNRREDFVAPAEASWWRSVPGASWRCPEGEGSSTAARENHPVVHVSWNDASAFARWAGGRLPSEAEWEFAARGGLEGKRFPWGDEEPTDEQADRCNIWQGTFPTRNTAADGFAGTAPVDSFQPNAYGLFNAVGNVWEWCADAFRVRSLKAQARARNARARREHGRVLKGGSYLCHRSYCYRYRNAARTFNTPDTSCGHIGFRVVFDI